MKGGGLGCFEGCFCISFPKSRVFLWDSGKRELSFELKGGGDAFFGAPGDFLGDFGLSTTVGDGTARRLTAAGGQILGSYEPRWRPSMNKREGRS